MRNIFTVLILGLGFSLSAQFHSLTMPKASPEASLRQQVWVTFVEINYHSPASRGRNVWTNSRVIPQNAEPIPWRAGANMNTTISFDSDVEINGQALAAGSYGFHIIPNGHSHTLLFAQPDNLWGSYYLDVENQVVLKVEVQDTSSAFNEYLNYVVIDRDQNSAVFALKWEDRMIPFTVSVDLNKTTVEKWRYELNGENTYQWEAWNDAAAWCLRNNTNLDEALGWVNRSINGGYGGFAGHLSFRNLSTKLEILDALAKHDELAENLELLQDMSFDADDAHYMGATLLKLKQDKSTVKLMEKGLADNPGDWGMYLYLGIAHYYLGAEDARDEALESCSENCPEGFKPRLKAIQKQMENGEYEYPQRKA